MLSIEKGDVKNK